MFRFFPSHINLTGNRLTKGPYPNGTGMPNSGSSFIGVYIRFLPGLPREIIRSGTSTGWQHDGFNGAVKEYHKKKFGEETSYYQLAPQFKAELYNPDDWAKLIEESGAKYVVLTSKHHDGFALWPSKEASRDWGFPWNAVEAGPHRDLLGDLFKAIRKTPMHAGMYYSLYEWFNPLWLNDKPRYVSEHMWPQMKDLINTYQPDVFWTDGEWEAPAEFWKIAGIPCLALQRKSGKR